MLGLYGTILLSLHRRRGKPDVPYSKTVVNTIRLYRRDRIV